MSYKKFIVATDNHGGLVCHKAQKVLMDFVKSWQPHYRIHLGDLWDFSPLRRGASQEEKAHGIADDYIEGLNFLDEYKPHFLTLGNHDDRIWQYAQHCADGMLQERCQELVQASEKEFKRRKIAFCEYKVTKFLRMPEGGPKLIHGFRSTVSPAKAHFDNWGSCLHGHCHTVDEHTARHVDGGKAYSVGCMADLDKLSYSDRQPAKLGHRNGFLYGIINTKTGDWKAWQVTKENGAWISPQGIL